jgi:hypothetical protein
MRESQDVNLHEIVASLGNNFPDTLLAVLTTPPTEQSAAVERGLAVLIEEAGHRLVTVRYMPSRNLWCVYYLTHGDPTLPAFGFGNCFFTLAADFAHPDFNRIVVPPLDGAPGDFGLVFSGSGPTSRSSAKGSVH